LENLQINPLAASPKASLFVVSCPQGEITTDENSVEEPAETFQNIQHINEIMLCFLNVF